MKIKNLFAATFISLSSIVTGAAVAISDLPITDSRKTITVSESSPTFSVKLAGTGWHLSPCHTRYLIKSVKFKPDIAVSDTDGAATYDQFDVELSPEAFDIPYRFHLSFVRDNPVADTIHSFKSELVIDGKGMLNCHFGLLRECFTIDTIPRQTPRLVKRDT